MSQGFNLVSQLTLPSRPAAVGLSPSGATVVAACGRTLWMTGVKDVSQARVCEIEHPVSELRLCEGRPIVAAATGTAAVHVYDLQTREHIRRLTKAGAFGSLQRAPTSHIGLYPGGQTLVATTDGSRVFLFNVETGLWEHIMFVKYDGCDVSVSPSGTHVLIFGKQKPSEISGQLTMYRVNRGLEPLWTRWHESDEAVTSAAFSIDGRQLVTCGAGDGARLWQVESGEPVDWRPPHESGRLIAAWFAGDDGRLATVDRSLRVYQLGRTEPIAEAAIEPPAVMARSADGKTIVMGRDGPVLDVWKMK